MDGGDGGRRGRVGRNCVGVTDSSHNLPCDFQIYLGMLTPQAEQNGKSLRAVLRAHTVMYLIAMISSLLFLCHAVVNYL